MKEPRVNPRDRTPKPTKRSIAKVEKLKQIQKNLVDNEKKMLDYRQERLNNRRHGGIDKLISKTLPSFVKGDLSDVPEFMRKKRERKDKN